MPLDANRNYIPPAASGYFRQDAYNFGAPQPGVQPNVQPVKFDARVVDTTEEGQIIHWRVIVEDARGGLNAKQGNFKDLYDRVKESSLDTRFHKTLILPQLMTAASSPDPSTSGVVGVHSLNIFNRLMIGYGSGNGSSLFRETSLSSPVLVATSYNPSSSITGLYPIVVGGATSAQMMAITRATDPIQVISDNTGTVAGTMHADTDGSWGINQTYVNDKLILIYANGAIRTLAQSSAITAQPDVGLSNVPNGGSAMGLIKLGGAPMRPAWFWPNQDTPGGAKLVGSEVPGKVVTTNIEGTDYQEIPFGLPYCFWSVNFNNSAFISSDRQRIMYYDGKTAARDLGWIVQRNHESDEVVLAYDGFVNGNELWVDVHIQDVNGLHNVRRHYEVYNFETNSWHQVSASSDMGSSSPHFATSGNGMPFSQTTGFTQMYYNGSWNRIFVPVYGYNPYDLYRNTTGSDSSSGNEYESTGTWYSPSWELPGLEGWPKVTTRILFLGNVDAGGSNATVSVTAGNLSANFGTGLENRDQVANLADNLDMWYKLNMEITLNRTTGSTRFTPNGFPVVVEGYCFVGNNLPLNGFLTDVR